MDGVTSFTPLPAKTHFKPPLTPRHLQSYSSNSSQRPNNYHYNTNNDNKKRKQYKFPPSRKNKPTFKESDAFPWSLLLHARNPTAIYRDLKELAEENKLNDALSILKYLDRKGVPVNPTTFSSLIAACVRSKSLTSGRMIHTYIRINGLEKNEFLCTKLVNMYTSCGSVEDAKRVFDEMPSSSVYPWNALLRGNVVHGMRQYGEVLHTFLKMRELGIDLNVYSFSCLMKSFSGASAVGQGLKTHALLVKNGLLGSLMLQTGLIDLYFKCGKIKLARRMFEEIVERDIVVWGTMIAGFAHNRLQREAINYVRWMCLEGLDPNSVILTTILPVIGEVGARELGREVHAYVLKTKSYSKQLFIQSSLIDMYCKCGDLVSGRKVFYGSMERNAVSWTALMAGYASNGKLEQALRSIVWMQQEGFKPDIVTFATVLPVCAKLKALRQGKEIHGFVLKNGFLPYVSVVTSLMMMYSKCSVLEYSSRLFQGMEKKNVIAWTAMIDSHVESGHLEEATDVFRSMQLSKHRPDSVAIARMLSVCGKLGAVKLGKEIHGQVLKKDLCSIPFVSSEIVKMYGVCGAIHKAKLFFDAIPVKGVMTWTSLIEAYGYEYSFEEAMTVFKEMRSDGFSPNHHTFKALLCICERAGSADEACHIFKLMTQRYDVKPSEDHYSIIIRLLHRVGRIEESQRYVQLRSSMSS